MLTFYQELLVINTNKLILYHYVLHKFQLQWLLINKLMF